MLTPTTTHVEAMNTEACLNVIDLLPGMEECPKLINLATRL